MATWSRASLPIAPDTRVIMSGIEPTITLRSSVNTGIVRVGIYLGTDRLLGWWVPFLPANIAFTIYRGHATAVVGGERRDVSKYLRDWDGVRWPTRDSVVPHAGLVLTLDQEPDKAVPILVDVSTEAVEVLV